MKRIFHDEFSVRSGDKHVEILRLQPVFIDTPSFSFDELIESLSEHLGKPPFLQPHCERVGSCLLVEE